MVNGLLAIGQINIMMSFVLGQVSLVHGPYILVGCPCLGDFSVVSIYRVDIRLLSLPKLLHVLCCVLPILTQIKPIVFK